MICKSRSIECEFWRRINNYNVPKKWVPCHSSSSTPINNSKSAHGSNIPSMCTLIHVAIHGLGRTIPEQTRFSVFLCTTYGEVVNSCLNVLSANVIPRNSLHNLQTPKNLCTCLFPIHRDNMGTERVQACRVENLFGGVSRCVMFSEGHQISVFHPFIHSLRHFCEKLFAVHLFKTASVISWSWKSGQRIRLYINSSCSKLSVEIIRKQYFLETRQE